jgi:hypothetical protein
MRMRLCRMDASSWWGDAVGRLDSVLGSINDVMPP